MNHKRNLKNQKGNLQNRKKSGASKQATKTAESLGIKGEATAKISNNGMKKFGEAQKKIDEGIQKLDADMKHIDAKIASLKSDSEAVENLAKEKQKMVENKKTMEGLKKTSVEEMNKLGEIELEKGVADLKVSQINNTLKSMSTLMKTGELGDVKLADIDPGTLKEFANVKLTEIGGSRTPDEFKEALKLEITKTQPLYPDGANLKTDPAIREAILEDYKYIYEDIKKISEELNQYKPDEVGDPTRLPDKAPREISQGSDGKNKTFMMKWFGVDFSNAAIRKKIADGLNRGFL